MALKLEYLKNQSLQACESLAQIQSEGMHLLRQRRCTEFIQMRLTPKTEQSGLTVQTSANKKPVRSVLMCERRN